MGAAFGWGTLAGSSLVRTQPANKTAARRSQSFSALPVLRSPLVAEIDSGRLEMKTAAGFALFQESSSDVVAVVLAFAAGAILTMLANTMMPEAFEHGGKLVGVVTTLGFAVSYAIHILG